MSRQDQFPAIFDRLKTVLAAHAPPLTVATDQAGDYGVVATPSPKYPAGHPFGVVRIKKNYVSFHLFPISMFPELVDGVPEPLRKRMRGKTCFNFAKEDEALFEDLARLTAAGLARYREHGRLPSG